MKRVLQWIGVVIAALAALVLVLHLVGQRRLNHAPALSVREIAVPSDSAAVARGGHLADAVAACKACHEAGFRGSVLVDAAPLGRITAPNLTAGTGGTGARYSDADWLRAIRHGVGSDGRTLVLMPCEPYSHLSDADMGSLIAYLKTLPPVDNTVPSRAVAFPGTIFLGVFGFGSLPVNTIDHAAAGSGSAPAGVSEEAGRYLVEAGACRECHGANLAGNTKPNGPPMGPNLTPRGLPGKWTEEDFVQVIRTGLLPDDERALDPEEMPWPYYAGMTDEELRAIWAYLRSLPPREDGRNE